MGQKQFRSQRATDRQKELAAKKKRDNFRRIVAIISAVVIIATGSLTGALLYQNTDEDSANDDTSAYSLPDKSVAEDKTWNAVIKTSIGDFNAELYGKEAPQAVANFIQLSKDNYWTAKDAQCPRLTTSEKFALLQCGAPGGDQAGGPGYSFGPIENAPADNVYPAGTIAMARQGGNGESMGSQFFIVYRDTDIPADDAGGYTIFGKITSGLDVLEKLGEGGTADGAADGAPKETISVTAVDVS